MTTKKLLKGLEYRVENLKAGLQVLAEKNIDSLVHDYEVRLDELESVIKWVKKESK